MSVDTSRPCAMMTTMSKGKQNCRRHSGRLTTGGGGMVYSVCQRVRETPKANLQTPEKLQSPSFAGDEVCIRETAQLQRGSNPSTPRFVTGVRRARIGTRRGRADEKAGTNWRRNRLGKWNFEMDKTPAIQRKSNPPTPRLRRAGPSSLHFDAASRFLITDERI
jgi:hypothetical protein